MHTCATDGRNLSLIRIHHTIQQNECKYFFGKFSICLHLQYFIHGRTWQSCLIFSGLRLVPRNRQVYDHAVALGSGGYLLRMEVGIVDGTGYL